MYLYSKDAGLGYALKPLRVISLFLSLRRAGASLHLGHVIALWLRSKWDVCFLTVDFGGTSGVLFQINSQPSEIEPQFPQCRSISSRLLPLVSGTYARTKISRTMQNPP
jgi:hypothetical protein